MKWQEIRERYPDSWLLVEALKAHTADDKRILDDLAVIDSYGDGQEAWKAYEALHLSDPQREMFVLHSSREEPNIKIKRWVGLRGMS